MRVIGTSGHVDHGKSTLVKTITGINPDRLEEEQARQLTIDLGFAWVRLPNQEMIGIVDVPGHRDFIENMLAGVGSLDAAMLVIAADEGVMPQTREHLAILDLLGVSNVIVVLSKIDIIEDPEWIELIKLDIEELISQTSNIKETPIVPVSAITKQGIAELLDTLGKKLRELPPRVNYHHPHLPIDRIFSVSGFGTVVTGTLTGGKLNIGDTIELQPGGKIGRIRGLQSYKQTIETAIPGSRVAVNIAGINKNEITRGDVMTYPGQIHPTTLIDVHFKYLLEVDRPLRHNAEVKFFSGASESIANVRLLNDEIVHPGNDTWLQIRLHTPIPLSRGDRFILRYPSPAETIGGGIIVNQNPGRRWRRFQKTVIEDLSSRLEGTPSERLAKLTETKSPIDYIFLQRESGLSDVELQDALKNAISENLIIQLDNDLYWSILSYEKTIGILLSEVTIFHEENPLRLGIPKPELWSKINIRRQILDLLINSTDELILENNMIRNKNHSITFSTEQLKSIKALKEVFAQNPYSPPSIEELNKIASEAIIRALIDLKEVIKISDTILFSIEIYEEFVSEITKYITSEGHIDVKTVRDKFNTTRKYAIAILEYLDSQGITQRIGDIRQLKKNSPQSPN